MDLEASEIMKRAHVADVEIDKLRLDPKNVRFQHLQKELTEKEIEEYILRESDTSELYKQILEAKGIYEPLVVDSNMIAKEGARRLVCLRKLKQEAHQKKLEGIRSTIFDKVRCVILMLNTPEKEIGLYLAAIHVKGKKPWAAFNKAKHIFNLHDVHKLSYDRIAKNLAMGKGTVIRNVDVYKATQNYGDLYPEDKEWFRKFTYFEEWYKRRDLKEFREKIELEKFAEWVSYNKFGDHRDIRNFAKILSNPEALEKFERENFAAAYKIIELKDPAVTSPKFRQIKKTIEILRSFSWKELNKTSNDPNRIELLKSLRKEVQDLLKGLETMKKS